MPLRIFLVSDLNGWCLSRRIWSRLLAAGAALAVVFGTSPTQNAVANGDTRTLTMHHAHTKESITITFRQQGSYDRAALEKLNWFLRDWRNDEQTQMDPRLFDVVWAVWREVGSSAPILIVSSYRSPVTNNMLRRRSSAVAKNSQHMAGKAMDLHMPDVSMAKVREIGMRLQNGGVGYYPTAGTPFVHLDVGSVRSWPRMPRQQLERLFPDGKTVHLPADGTPLPGYEAALAMIQSRGGSAFSYADVTSPRRSLWAMLFGGEDEEAEVPVRRGRNGRVIAQSGTPAARQVASAPVAQSDSSSVYAVGAPAQPTTVAAAPQPAPARPAPRPQPVEETPEQEARPTTQAALPAAAPETKTTGNERKAVDLPLPPRRPGDLMATALASANVPLPPVRPALVAFADSGATAFAQSPPAGAALERGTLPAAITSASLPEATALRAVAVPLPPVRPATQRAAASAAVPAPAAVQPPKPTNFTVKLDSAGLSALIASEPEKRRSAKVETPDMRQAAGGNIVAGKFRPTAAPAPDGRFSGGLARPVEAGFTRRGE